MNSMLALKNDALGGKCLVETCSLVPGGATMKKWAYRVAEQMRCPSGALGVVAAAYMRKNNRDSIMWTLDALSLTSGDHVLEIGFGPGLGVQEAIKRMKNGIVNGIDTSDDMLKMASRLNKKSISQGKVLLSTGDANHLPYEDASFDKIFCINVIYFWKDPKRPLGEILRTIKTGGTVALYMVPKEELLRMKPSSTDVFKGYDKEDVLNLFESAGYKNCRVEVRKERIRTGMRITGQKTK